MGCVEDPTTGNASGGGADFNHLAPEPGPADLTIPTGTAGVQVPRLELLEAMVEGAREGLCILSPRSTILHSNQAAGELLGFDPKQVEGRPVHELGVDRDFDWSISGEVIASCVAVSTVQTLR